MLHPVSKGIIAILIGLAAGPAVAAGTAAASPAPPTLGQPQLAAPTTQGIIMSDGRICNPRWGC
jgi:hypothetical protein